MAFIAEHIPPTHPHPSEQESESSLGDCGAATCMRPLAINLVIVYITRLTLGNVLEVLLPWLLVVWRRRKFNGESIELTEIELDYHIRGASGCGGDDVGHSGARRSTCRGQELGLRQAGEEMSADMGHDEYNCAAQAAKEFQVLVQVRVYLLYNVMVMRFQLCPYQYDEITMSLLEYVEHAIQFGYLVLFSAALPIGALAVLIGNILEIRGDLFKLLYLIRRPTPQSSQDICAWYVTAS